MILQALYQYYQQMHAVGADIAPPGMEKKAIPFIIELTPEGEFIQISETMDPENKKGKIYLVPRTPPGRTSGIVPNIMWDRPDYVLGIPIDDTGKESGRNMSFIDKVYELRELYPENPHIAAVARFYQDGHALRLTEDENQIKKIQKTTGANISFRVQNLEDKQLVASTQDVQSYTNRAIESDSNVGICLVTGQKSMIIRTHPKVKLGVKEAPLISFQESSGFDSYGKEKGFNAPISVHAAGAIATALNDLLTKGKNTNYRVGDTAFVFWSNLANEELLSSYRTATFNGIFSSTEDGEENLDLENSEEGKSKKSRRKKKNAPSPITQDRESYRVLQTLKAACGYKGGKLHEDIGRFYILGLAPNSTRISIKLWAEGSISEIVGNTLQHQYDMNIISEKGNVDAETPPLRSIYQIVKTVSSSDKSSKSDKSDKWSSNLIQSIVESIVENKPYPQSLQQACLERIRRGDRITELRAAILKAYINRKKQQEYITMSLDPNQTNKAYLAGRLFALFESIQQCALGGNLNRTIRDAYYGTASTTPRTIFGRLDALSKVHLSKLRKEKPGLAILKEKQLEEIYNLIPGGAPEMPTHFSLDDQSIFAVGYYHQRVEAWRKKEETEDHLEE